MKFIYYLFASSIFCIIVFFSTEQAGATGTFQFLNFNTSSTAVLSHPFSDSIDFLYSGNGIPEASLIGTNLPEGMELSSITERGSGLYSFTFEGRPEKAGEYSLIFSLVDNIGALLTEFYTFKVIEPSISFSADFPDGVVGEKYSGSVSIDYIGEVWVEFSTLPGGLSGYIPSRSNSTEYPSGTKTVEVSGFIMAEGTYSFNVLVAMVNNQTYNRSESFNLVIKKAPIEITPSDDIEPTQTTTTPNNKSNNEERIKSFINEEKTKLISIDDKLCERLKGRILLQVENHGEAWYINPKNSKKYYMANGSEAYNIMRYLGVGITNNDLNRVIADKNFAKKHNGKIFLQVENHGEAYFIDVNGNAHYLRNGSEAYNIMRDLGLGITNNDLRKIDIDEIN